MPPAPILSCDESRLGALVRYNLLDTPLENAFDQITWRVREQFTVPIALISLVDRDRQWFKSHIGLDVRETSRNYAFCSYAILQHKVLIVEDALNDHRFFDNPLVTDEPNIRFYAGAQLMTYDRFHLGTLCIIDTVPRKFSKNAARQLRFQAQLVMNEIEQRCDISD